MRTVILLGSIIVGGAITGLPGWAHQGFNAKTMTPIAIVFMVSMFMDIVDFIRGK